MKGFYLFFKKMWSFVVDTLFPKSELQILIEKCDKEEFARILPRENYIFEDIESILPYRNKTVNQLTKLIKYGADINALKIAAIIYREKFLEIIGDEIQGTKWLLVPIPASKQRKKEHGFDQMQYICEEIMKIENSTFLEYRCDILMRNDNRDRQTELKNRKNRIENMKNAFYTEGECRNRKIFLIDDVTTTGATLRDARRALKNAGAKKIICIALAH